jgi:hypothetical protein
VRRPASARAKRGVGKKETEKRRVILFLVFARYMLYYFTRRCLRTLQSNNIREIEKSSGVLGVKTGALLTQQTRFKYWQAAGAMMKVDGLGSLCGNISRFCKTSFSLHGLPTPSRDKGTDKHCASAQI